MNMRYLMMIALALLAGCTEAKVQFGKDYRVTKGFYAGKVGTAATRNEVFPGFVRVTLVYFNGWTAHQITVDESELTPVQEEK